jgi:hypothetical protein
MKFLSQIAAAMLLLASLSSFLLAQAAHSGYDPAEHAGSLKPGSQDSFLGFTLHRINPSETDCGQSLSAVRSAIVDHTARNGYFWSNVVALGLLGLLFLIVVYQRRIQAKREWMMAEVLAGFEHSLARSMAQVDEATKKNRELTDALAVLRELSVRRAASPLEPAERDISSAAKPRTTNTQPAPQAIPSNSAKPQNGSAGRTVLAKRAIDQMRLFTPDADFVMKVNSLEQQLAQSREENKQLRRQMPLAIGSAKQSKGEIVGSRARNFDGKDEKGITG